MASCQSTARIQNRPLFDRLPLDSLRRPHPFIREDGIRCLRLLLTQGQFAFVDEADAALISGCVWAASWSQKSRTYYAYRNGGNGKNLAMHRVITQAPLGDLVDHRNGNGLDNRRDNLRVCRSPQNVANSRKPRRPGLTSKFKGVSFAKARRRWYAKIKIQGRATHLASCGSALHAALIYDSAAVAEYGQFAKINFPERIGLPGFVIETNKMTRREVGLLGAKAKWSKKP